MMVPLVVDNGVACKDQEFRFLSFSLSDLAKGKVVMLICYTHDHCPFAWSKDIERAWTAHNCLFACQDFDRQIIFDYSCIQWKKNEANYQLKLCVNAPHCFGAMRHT